MNRRKFNKKIDQLIKKGNLYVATLEEIIEQDEKSLLFRGKTIDYINEDLDKIIYNSDITEQVIEYLYSFPKLREGIDKNIIKYLSLLEFYGISYLIGVKKLKLMEKINNNFIYFLDCVKLETIVYIYYMNKSFVLTEENKKILNERMKNNKEVVAKVFFGDTQNDKKDYKSVLDVIIKIIDELLDYAIINYIDIKFIGCGSTSKVLLIGDKVLKIGGRRTTYNIPNDERLLKPLIRVNLENFSDVTGTIEVVNKVDTNIIIDKRALYDLYKELRDKGIIFTDIKPSNLGYLLSSNGYHFDKILADNPISRGISGESVKELPKGSIVIIDSDYLYKDNDENVKSMFLAQEFDRKYKYEKEMDEYIEDIELDKPKTPKI